MRERQIVVRDTPGRQLIWRVWGGLVAVVKRVRRRGMASVLALTGRPASPTPSARRQTCSSARLSRLTNGSTTLVGPVSEPIDRFPLARYEAYMAESRTRDVSVVHGCVSDLGPTAAFFGVPEEARVSRLLISRRGGAGALPSSSQRPRRGSAQVGT
jgi:hypothetical protein